MIKRILEWCWRIPKGMFSWYVSLYKGRRWYVKLLSGILSFVVFMIVYLGMVDINFLGLFGKSPGFYEILHPPSSVASEVYSADGKMIGKFFNENRSPVKYEEVAPIFWKALIDTEDERFYQHRGVDFRGILGAVKDALVHHEARGASTLTQQLAKNMFRMRTQNSSGLLSNIPGLRIIIIKSKEWIIASKIEMVYSKEEILTMYANTVDFGSNCFGIKTASRTYFDTTPGELTTDQSAVLVGILKATSFYNPIINPENSTSRRNVVMSLMVQHGHLSKSEYQRLSSSSTPLKLSVDTGEKSHTAYFKDAVEASLASWCHSTGYDLYTSGLKIYTTLDTHLQKYAENAVKMHMKTLQAEFRTDWGGNAPWRDDDGNVIPHFIENIAQKLPVYKELERRFGKQTDSIEYYLNQPHKVKLYDYDRGYYEAEMSTLDSIRTMVSFMHAGFIAMEPQSGAVLAWVGDVDYNTWQYDKVTAMRQPGSTFKAFIYTEAMNQGLVPCDKRRDEPVKVPIYDEKTHQEQPWNPNNASKSFSGDSMLLKRAFAKSTNSIAVRLGIEMGVKNVIKTAHEMGIKSELDPHPTTLLGSSDVNLLELVNSYGTIANDGMRHEPVLVTRILDGSGNLIYEGPTDAPRAIPYRSAFFMQQMLMNGVQEGTSRSLSSYVGYWSKTDVGGKTGTSNNMADGWFVGITPKLVFGAWVGGEYRQIHFRSSRLGQGAHTALPICGKFLQSVIMDNNYAKYRCRFVMPPGEDVNIDLFNCTPKVRKSTGSVANDSTLLEDEATIYDIDGNPLPSNPPSNPDNGDLYLPDQPIEFIIEE